MNSIPPFHLAIPVNNLDKARHFYGKVLECPEGRSTDRWIDFNFFGHQFVTHLAENFDPSHVENPVDSHNVPVPHFGVVLNWEEWHNLAEKLEACSIEFILKPTIRYKDQLAEQGTMFFKDPFGNALEFKSFKQITSLFEK